MIFSTKDRSSKSRQQQCLTMPLPLRFLLLMLVLQSVAGCGGSGTTGEVLAPLAGSPDADNHSTAIELSLIHI